MFTYNPKEVVVSIGGSPVRGFAEDSFIAIDAKNDGIQSSVGCDGEIMRSVDPSNQMTIRLTIQQSSTTNAKLMDYYLLGKKYGTGVFSVLITGVSGQTIFSDDCWVVRPASQQRGRTAGNMEWTLESQGVVDALKFEK